MKKQKINKIKEFLSRNFHIISALILSIVWLYVLLLVIKQINELNDFASSLLSELNKTFESISKLK
jgi:hypothetical protein